METLGDRVKRLREKRGLRPEHLAIALDVSVQTIRNLEQNKSDILSARIKPLARVLSVTTDYLLGMNEESEPVDEAATAVALMGV